MLNYQRYRRVPVAYFPERTWPEGEIQGAPTWCSVDLRDGSQALVGPIVVEEKIEMFNLLIKLGFKEIEVGFSVASQIEYDFLRQLVDHKLTSDDVVIQVSVQCREHLIKKTFEAIRGVKKSVVYIYNSTSTLQRDVALHKNMEEIKEIAVEGTSLVKKYAKHYDGELFLEYSPESFTGTELDYALDIYTAVQETRGVIPDDKIIINPPPIVEATTPNVYADRIEWINTHLENRDSIILSVHPHNDKGTGVAATELALLAGVDRVEGMLFSNGGRIGNVDVLTLAYNMFSQGINLELNIENIRKISDVYERCTETDISPRYLYAGKLVSTAFSDPHQDAINKGMQALHKRNGEYWEVPYLPIGPSDIGHQYEPIVRTSSQSDKGGIAFMMDTSYGFKLSKGMHREFTNAIQKISEKRDEVVPEQIMGELRSNYSERKEPIHFRKCQITDTETKDGEFAILAKVIFIDHDVEKHFEGVGNGPIDAVQSGLESVLGIEIRVLDYNKHALTSGPGVQVASYIHLMDVEAGRATYGVGISSNIIRASIRGIFSAANRLLY